MIRVNGKPLDLVEPKPMRLKLYEPILLVGVKEFEDIDIHIRVRGGGHVAQIYGMLTINYLTKLFFLHYYEFC